MNAKPAIIFDFDGTIADSLLVTLQILYELVHHKPLPPENIGKLRAHGSLALLRELHIPLWRAIGLLPRVRRRLSKADKTAAPITGVPDAIRELSRSHRLFILSASSRSGIEAFLARHHLQDCFVRIYGNAVAWRKAPYLRQLLHDEALEAEATWYVGDRTWDVRAARAAGIHTAAVTWGFNNARLLKRTHPEVLIFMPVELVAKLQVIDP